MKQLFKDYKKLHIWLLIDLLGLAAFFLCRGQKPWMNAIQNHFTGPLRRMLGKVSYLVDFSVMELVIVLAVLSGVAYVLWSIRAVARAKGKRLWRTYSAVLLAACVGLMAYDGFCLLWGVNYWTDSFQEQSGIIAQPIAEEDLLRVTEYFAARLAESADGVARDEEGFFAVPVQELLDFAPKAYDGVERQFPFLEFDDPGVKPMFFSRTFSRMDFTGVYCSFTGESNVNVDSPACLLGSTICHELAHQRGIASEQECNFLSVLASTTCGNPAYEYSGWLKGYIHLSNALYRVDREAWQAVRDTLPETVRLDLAYNNAYWDQFADTVIQTASTTIYDGMLKAYGDEMGIQSYGTVVDMLVVYYKCK